MVQFIKAAFIAGTMMVAHHTHHHRHHHHRYYVDSTCYNSGGQTADGGYTYVGQVANNFLRFGTKILLSHRVFGHRRFTVTDRIGWGSELDFFYPSKSACDQYGRQRISFIVLQQ